MNQRIGSPAMERISSTPEQRSQAIEAALRSARMLFAEGRVDQARETVVDKLQQNWVSFPLWSELVSMMQVPSDFGFMSELWLRAPKQVHSRYGTLNAFSRAAAISGNHIEARATLRRLIKLSYNRSRPGLKRWLRKRTSAKSGEKVFTSQALVALRDMYEVLANGPTPFLVSGSLLGHVREGGFIAWDKDIDVGVMVKEGNSAELEAALRLVPKFSVRKVDMTSNRVRLVHDNTTMIDVFPHYQDPNRDLIWHDGAATRWWNSTFGLAPARFLGIDVMVPDDPERYLDENYGDWRTPAPNFDARLDTPNVEVTNPEYLHTIHYFDLVSAIRGGKAHKQRRFAELLAGLESDPWFLRFAK